MRGLIIVLVGSIISLGLLVAFTPEKKEEVEPLESRFTIANEDPVTLVSCAFYCRKNYGKKYWCAGLLINDDNTVTNVCSNGDITQKNEKLKK